MWVGSDAYKWRILIALDVSLDILLRSASTGVLTSCPKRRNWGTCGTCSFPIVAGV